MYDHALPYIQHSNAPLSFDSNIVDTTTTKAPTTTTTTKPDGTCMQCIRNDVDNTLTSLVLFVERVVCVCVSLRDMIYSRM